MSKGYLEMHASAASTWHTLPLTIADQQVHIDRSEQLLRESAPGRPAILYWSQAQPAGLVLGFSQKMDCVNQDALAEQALPLYHRRAGGTAVLVGPGLLALDVVLPADHPLVQNDIVESYRWFGETWVRALRHLGVTSRTVPPTEAHAQRLLAKQEETRERESLLRRACYASNSSYEVVVGQRKIVGLDMIRRRNGSLLQAGVLLTWSVELLARLLGHTPIEQDLLRHALPERAVGLDELTGRSVPVQEIIQAFATSLQFPGMR